MVVYSSLCVLSSLLIGTVNAQQAPVANGQQAYAHVHDYDMDDEDIYYNDIYLDGEDAIEEVTQWTTVQLSTTILPSQTHTEHTTVYFTPKGAPSPADANIVSSSSFSGPGQVLGQVPAPAPAPVSAFTPAPAAPRPSKTVTLRKSRIFSSAVLANSPTPAPAQMQQLSITRPANAPHIAKAREPVTVTTTIMAGGPLDIENAHAINLERAKERAQVKQPIAVKAKEFKAMPVKLAADTSDSTGDSTDDSSNNSGDNSTDSSSCEPEDDEEDDTDDCPTEDTTPDCPTEDVTPDCPTEDVTPDCPVEDDTPDCPTEDVTPDCASPPPPPCAMYDVDYEHQYGDDAIDFVLDTKDHIRDRFAGAKDRAKVALSHVRPHHVHERVHQVLHDKRPDVSDQHQALHDRNGRHVPQHQYATYERSKRARKAQRAHVLKDSCGACQAPVEDCSCEPPAKVVRARYQPPARKAIKHDSCGTCQQPVVDCSYPSTDATAPAPAKAKKAKSAPKKTQKPKAKKAPVPKKASCSVCSPPPVALPPPVHDTTCGCSNAAVLRDVVPGCSDYEHQYGDDTMDFILDTKDHIRGWWGNAKERTKQMLSHASPRHLHQRVSQLLHDRRPVASDEHLALHDRKGRSPSRRDRSC